jgi:DNA-binding LytR/AlgR family response regulator
VYQIKITEIEYIEGLKDYAKIYLTNQERVVIRESLKRIASSLAEYNFVRVHRSYIVLIQKITSIYGNTIKFGSREVPVGKVQRDVLLDKFKQGVILGD